MSVFGAVANVTLLAALVITFGTPVDAAQPEAGRIVSITPSKARTGDRVTINGTGFGATNVRVTVGGKRAQLVSATGDQATFQIPDGVVPGATVVAATNPGGHTGTIGLTVLEGSLLGGSPTARALDALSNMPPVRVGRNVVDNGIIMSRIDVRLTADATVADLNAALLAVDGGIVSMAPGIPALTIAVPRQPTVDALLALIRALSGRPGIALAKLAREAGLMTFLEDRDFPLTEFNVELAAHLLPPRFVAAWNAASRVVDGQGHCLQPAIPILIPDEFGATPSDFTNDIPASSFRFVSGAADPALLDVSGDPEDHGYLVTRIIGAAGGSTGANPFVSCLDFRAIQTGGLSETQGSMEIANNLPAGKFILSYSQGYNDDCIDLAVPRDQCITPRDPTIAVPFDRADDALLWKQLTRGRWSDFLVATSAGNSRDTDAPNIYLGTGDSHFTNKMAISQLPDPLFAFVEDGSLWSPSSPGQVAAGFEPLFNAGDAAGMALLVQQSGEDAAVADNVLVVGSTTTLSGATILSSGASPTAFAEATVTVIASSIRVGLGSRTCQSLVQGINGFFRTPIDGKTCDQYLNVFGDPAHPLPPPYAVPAMNVSGPVAGVFTYDAEYTESLSSTEVESNAVTGGQLRMKVEADAGVVQQGEVPNPPIVFSAASTSLSFLVLDDGPYLLTITGQISANFAFLNTVSLSVAFNSPNDPAIIVSLNQSGGQPISITKVLGRGINPATGQFFPSSVGIGLSAQAQISANAVAARTSGSEIAITFSFQRMP